MRLFVGIDLPEGVKEELHQLTLQLQRSSAAGSFVARENLHLTLVFVGETSRIDEAKTALTQAVTRYRLHPVSAGNQRFTLSLSGIGSFKQRRGYTWWVGLDETTPLAQLRALQREIEDSLRDSGFTLDRRSYKPHITLARSVRTRTLVQLEVPVLSFEVGEFVLFRSKAVQGRQQYTALASFSL